MGFDCPSSASKSDSSPFFLVSPVFYHIDELVAKRCNISVQFWLYLYAYHSLAATRILVDNSIDDAAMKTKDFFWWKIVKNLSTYW